MGYTIHQVAEFLSANERARREQRIGDTIMLRMAQGDAKPFKAYLGRLRKGE
jgi:hypothetical protein